MAKRLIDELTLIDIADAIREKSGKGELIDPINYGKEIRNLSSSDGDFLSTYVQELEKSGIWRYAFAGYGWTDKTFAPKSTIVVPNENSIRFMFQSSKISEITFNDIDSSRGTDLRNLFDGCSNLKYLEFNNGNNAPFQSTTFAGCTALEDLTFQNIIEVNGLNLEDCTSLNQNSTILLLSMLSDDPSIASGKSVTLPIHVKQWTDVEGNEANIWLNHATQAGWTIAFN